MYTLCFSAVSSECQTGPRTGFFHNFRAKEIVAKRYIPEHEEFSQDPVSTDELASPAIILSFILI